MGLFFVFQGDFWTDENWYYAGSWAFAKGRLPHVDFFIHHNPLVFYVYGLVQKTVGPSLLVGRLQSFVLWFLSLVLLCRIGRRVGGRWAGVLFLVLAITNPFSVRFFNTFSWRPLEAFLLALALTFLCADWSPRIRYPLVVAVLTLEVGLRYLIDLSSVLLLVFLIYVLVSQWRDKGVIALSVAVAISGLVILLLPYLILARDQYLFDAAIYPLQMRTILRSFGLLSHLDSSIGRIINQVSLAQGSLTRFFAAGSLLIAVLAYNVHTFWLRPRGERLAWVHSRGEWWFFILLYLILDEVLLVGSEVGTPVTRIVAFLLASLFISVESVRCCQSFQHIETRRQFVGMIILVLLVSPWLQSPQEVGARARWSDSDVHRIRQAARSIKAMTPPASTILSFYPAIVTEADRNVALDMIMEVWGIFPTWDTKTSQSHHLVNIPMLLASLDGGGPAAVVLTRPGRLEDDRGMGVLLKPYRDRIRSTIAARYTLAAAIPGPAVGYGVPATVEVYLPRR